MVVTDLDGTLLRKDKTISEYTASIFRRCSDRDIKIIFATARPIRAVKVLDIKIKSDACIYHNGAVVTVGDVIFRETGIKHITAKALLDKARQFTDMRMALEINDALHANFDASTIWPGVNTTLTNFSDLPELPADKIIFITAKSNEIYEIEKLLDDTLYWEISENEVLMVMNKNARKLNAINDIANHFGISLCEIAAFGDDYNDIEMLRECGQGVAVENAINEAKVVADFICLNNNEDGVAKWIEDYIL